MKLSSPPEGTVLQQSSPTSISYHIPTLSSEVFSKKSHLEDVLSVKATWEEVFSGVDFNINFSLIGRDHLGWKEGLSHRGSRAPGSCPAVSFPEERVHDNELPLGNTSASRQGRSPMGLGP